MPDIIDMTQRLAEQAQQEAEYSQHMDRISAMQQLLAAAIKSMREIGASNDDIARVLCHATTLVLDE